LLRLPPLAAVAAAPAGPAEAAVAVGSARAAIFLLLQPKLSSNCKVKKP
jgi:hypothetical protein